MPIAVRLDVARRQIRSEIVGDFSLADIFDAIDGIVDVPGFEPGFDILSDHTAVGEPLTPFQAEQMVAHLDSMRDNFTGSRWAAVVTSPASRGMMRMVAALAERVPVRVRVFGSLVEAEAWLAEPTD